MIVKVNAEDKVKRVMEEYKAGKLRTSEGAQVTDRNQALAIALSEAGISNKSLQKSEALIRAKQIRGQIKKMIDHELIGDKKVRKEIIDYMRGNPRPDVNHVYKIAEKHGVDKDDASRFVFKMFSESLVRISKKENQKVVIKEIKKEEIKSDEKIIKKSFSILSDQRD